SVASAATGVENTEARAYIPPAEASVSTWVGYDSPTAFSISYYTQGQNLGALLDLSIRNDTDGRSSLDDVMRALFDDFYKRGKGFTTEDMISIINRLTKKDYHDFYRRYIFGTEVPDYNNILGYAGYKFDKTVRQSPVFGFGARNRNGGLTILAVEPGSPATAAGLKVGDVITKINGEDARRSEFNDLAGKTIKLTVRRGSQEEDLTMNVGSREFTVFSAAELPSPNAKQLRVRESWLKR
ncbi:MAG TPA: PDZ domain-containing protein, partial [Pyrinomonadaceae bacterium]|nr:PDZ domain-containing protein [Pyrinomonadaceae bacterium]